MNKTVSMVNPRGRVTEIDEKKVSSFIEKGFKVVINPKEKYYPDLDKNINKDIPLKGSSVGTKVLTDIENPNPLGVFQM